MVSRASRRPSNSRSKGFSRTLIALIVFAIAVVSLVVLSLGNTNSSSRVQASTTMPNQKQKHYKGTRPIVVDRQTGQRRLPTQEEADQAAASLSELAKRPESLPEATAPAGGVALDLQGGFGGVILARPNEDGTWETRCVFTFEEGIAFLGLVEDIK